MSSTETTAYMPAVVAPPAEQPAVSVRAVWVSVAVLIALYVLLFISGIRFFVFKTALLPVLLAYGLLVRQQALFVTHWVPLVGAILLFDAIRGLIYVLIQTGYQTYYLEYVFQLEQAVFGVPAVSLWLQQFRTPFFDAVAVLIHASHFAFFLLFGLMLWHSRLEHFRYYRRALVFVMIIGLVGYAVIPTVPPWLAAEEQFAAIPPVAQIIDEVYTDRVPELYGAFATNPVAAMPSLHVAFPFACALIGWRAYGRRIGSMLLLYSLAVMLAVIYLGEHYAVDVIAGVLVAGVAFQLARHVVSPSLSIRATLAVGVALLVLTAAIGAAGPLIPLRTY